MADSIIGLIGLLSCLVPAGIAFIFFIISLVYVPIKAETRKSKKISLAQQKEIN